MATGVATLQSRQIVNRQTRKSDEPLVMRIATVSNGRWVVQRYLGNLAGWSSDYFYDNPLDALANVRFRRERDIVEIHCGMCFHRVDEVSYCIARKTPLVCCRACADRAMVQVDQATVEAVGAAWAAIVSVLAVLAIVGAVVALWRS
jgi:hypothetical protein